MIILAAPKSLSFKTSSQLFLLGSTVGPIVDSIHNQCLLEYNLLPISLSLPSSTNIDNVTPFFASSWAVPPLLGVAYVVLGGILPRLFEYFISLVSNATSQNSISEKLEKSSHELRSNALYAVASTALIIKLSDILEKNNSLPMDSTSKILILLIAALSQWALLDGTLAALLAASVTSLGGPLSELPFVANNVWHYLPSAADYFPLKDLVGNQLNWLLGDNYQQLALSSITGPCYFAVTMDAIAIRRWLESNNAEDKE